MAFSDIPLEQKQAALHDLKEIKALFAARNWFPGTSGNLSVRVGEFSPEQFYFAVTASGKDKSVHTPEDYLFVDQDGAPSEATGLKPSAETLIHCEIYRKTGCGAIFHVHTIDNNLISDWYGEQGYVPAQGIELIKAFNIWDEDAAIRIPVLPNYADIPRIAELVPDTLDPAVPAFCCATTAFMLGEKMPSRRKNIWRRSSLYSNTRIGVFFSMLPVLNKSTK